MLSFDILSAARMGLGSSVSSNTFTSAGSVSLPDRDEDIEDDAEDDVADVAGIRTDTTVVLGKRPFMYACFRSLVSADMFIVFSCPIGTIADNIPPPQLREMCRRFLWDQCYPDPDLAANDVPLDLLPEFDGNIAVHTSASATFYAPSELSGPGGMHREMIRSNTRWRGQYARFDTVLIINSDDEDEPMYGLVVGHILNFLVFTHNNVHYLCALVEWFMVHGSTPDPVTGMWVVKPEHCDHHGLCPVGLVHIDCIVRACNLIPVFGKSHMPTDFHFSYTLDAFKAFYVNHYIDYHACKCSWRFQIDVFVCISTTE